MTNTPISTDKDCSAVAAKSQDRLLEHPRPRLFDDKLVVLIDLELDLHGEFQVVGITFVVFGEFAMDGA